MISFDLTMSFSFESRTDYRHPANSLQIVARLMYDGLYSTLLFIVTPARLA